MDWKGSSNILVHHAHANNEYENDNDNDIASPNDDTKCKLKYILKPFEKRIIAKIASRNSSQQHHITVAWQVKNINSESEQFLEKKKDRQIVQDSYKMMLLYKNERLEMLEFTEFVAFTARLPNFYLDLAFPPIATSVGYDDNDLREDQLSWSFIKRIFNKLFHLQHKLLFLYPISLQETLPIGPSFS